LNDEIYLKSWK